jgi:hypothetical protein
LDGVHAFLELDGDGMRLPALLPFSERPTSVKKRLALVCRFERAKDSVIVPLASVVLPPPEEGKLVPTNVLWCNDGAKDNIDSVVAVLLGLIDDCDKDGAMFGKGSKTNIDVLVLGNGSDPFSAAADAMARAMR